MTPLRVWVRASGAAAPLLAAAGCLTLPSSSGQLPSRDMAATLGAGRLVFTAASQPRCGACHTLADAGSDGTLGPSLDELQPDALRVIAAVTKGVGIMGAQAHLTEEQVLALASYVSEVAGKS